MKSNYCARQHAANHQGPERIASPPGVMCTGSANKLCEGPRVFRRLGSVINEFRHLSLPTRL
jgi:hypothetical protein